MRNVFTLNTCASIVGAEVKSFAKETEMLEVRMDFKHLPLPALTSLPLTFTSFQKWAEFIRECDPDMITGYNIQNFDLPYLINRANHLKLPHFTYLGRLKDVRSTLRETVLQSRQMGKRENKVINIEGRVQFDLLQVS